MAKFCAPIRPETICTVITPSRPAFSRASSRCSLSSLRALASSASPAAIWEEAWPKPLSAWRRAFSSWALASERLVSSSMPSMKPPGMMPLFSFSRALSIWAMPASSWARPAWASAYWAFRLSGSSSAASAL